MLAGTIHHGQGIVIVPIQQIKPPRPPEADVTACKWADWDVQTLAVLRQRRWRVSPRERPLGRRTLGVVALLHVLFALLAWQALRPMVRMDRPNAQEVLHIRFLARAAAVRAPAPPLPSVPPLPQRTRPASHEPAAKQAMTIQLPTTRSAHKPATLYDREGQPLLPATSASSAPPGYVSHALRGDSRIMRHADPIKYKATSLDKYFPPPDETAGGAALRHVVDAVIKDQAVDLPGGIHLKCKTVLGIPTPDCINPPPPPSAKDGDERLSMAPAKPLAADPNARKPPSVEACIAIYRAGKPLPWGCPPDTPNRSVDAELRDRAAGAARAH